MKKLLAILAILLLTVMFGLSLTGCGNDVSPAEEVYSAE